MNSNILLITIDALRHDFVNQELTPFLYSIAKEGCFFENHFSGGPYTWASFPSLFSSTYPHMLGYGHMLNRASFVDVLREVGYETLGFPNSELLSPNWGYSKGFDYYEFDGGLQQSLAPSHVAGFAQKLIDLVESRKEVRVLLESSMAFVRDLILVEKLPIDAITLSKKVLSKVSRYGRRRPVFVWVHYMDLHAPHTLPIRSSVGRIRSSFSRALRLFESYTGCLPKKLKEVVKEGSLRRYSQAVKFVDKAIEFLVNELSEKGFFGCKDVLIITSDHGEEFFEHGAIGHLGQPTSRYFITHLFNELIKVPLLIWTHNCAFGRVKELTSHIDIAPTVLELIGTRKKMPSMGVNLLSEAVCNRDYVVSEASAVIVSSAKKIEHGKSYAVVRSDGLKYLFNPVLGEMLFNIKRDSFEMEDISQISEATCKEFRTLLSQHEKMKRRFELRNRISALKSRSIADRIRGTYSTLRA